MPAGRSDYSRRSFLGGVLTCGALSASAIYLLPGGRKLAPVPVRRTELTLVTGADPTGARQLLIELWNKTNPAATVQPMEVDFSSSTAREQMLTSIRAGQVDLLNLDVIDIPEFADKGLITPVPLADRVFLRQAKLVSQVADDSGRYWAAPFNTDVGMLFSRGPAQTDTPPRPLPELLDTVLTAGSRQFVAQLDANEANKEAFVVNVLEHALSREPGLLMGTDVSEDFAGWQRALEPVRAALASGKVAATGGEPESLDVFARDRPSYMRNWPVKYRELQQRADPDVTTGRIRLDPLPVGVLGGQSLAVAAQARDPERALAFVDFMTDVPAQTILAGHGLAPTRVEVYSDHNLRALVPHLNRLQAALDEARPRPVHANYRAFADVFFQHTRALFRNGRPLTAEFIVKLKEQLR